MSTQPSIQVGNLDIEWDLERGDVRIFGLDSVMFWTNPSLYRLLAPLVEELGVERFRLLVAHSSSIGTDTDYEVMVTKLGTDFVSGFLAWGEAVSAAGWGRFEVLTYDPKTCTAHVRVHNPWELHMQQGEPVAWGCPFLQGKVIGLFTYAFGRACWAEEVVVLEPGQSRLDLHVHPSDRVLEQELAVLRAAVQAEREVELVARVEQATTELRNKIAVIDHQRELIARLTYPILQVWEGVLAAVLVGELNDTAMSDLGYALLERVQSTRSRHVLLDCTGVPSLGSQQASNLARLVATVRLLGAQPTLVGLSPAVAEELAHDSDALRGVRTLRTLADALQRIGLRRP
jgi:rsbT co-antagonist protein RsbR